MTKVKTISEYTRLVWIHSLCKSSGVTFDDYCYKFGMSKRTFYRDIEKLKIYFNAPIILRYNRYTYKDKTFELPMLFISEKEFFYLSIALILLRGYKDTPIWQELYKIITRINTPYPAKINQVLSDIKPLYQRRTNPEIIYLLLKAIINKNKIKIFYHSFSSGQKSWREIEPYHIYSFKGELYLIAYSYKHATFRDYFIGRIQQIYVYDTTFRSRSFNLRTYLNTGKFGIIKGQKNDKFVKVTFRINKKYSHWVIERYGGLFKEEKDTPKYKIFSGNILATDEFINWALGFGDKLKILKPKNLKINLLKKVKSIMTLYDTNI